MTQLASSLLGGSSIPNLTGGAGGAATSGANNYGSPTENVNVINAQSGAPTATSISSELAGANSLLNTLSKQNVVGMALYSNANGQNPNGAQLSAGFLNSGGLNTWFPQSSMTTYLVIGAVILGMAFIVFRK